MVSSLTTLHVILAQTQDSVVAASVIGLSWILRTIARVWHAGLGGGEGVAALILALGEAGRSFYPCKECYAWWAKNIKQRVAIRYLEACIAG